MKIDTKITELSDSTAVSKHLLSILKFAFTVEPGIYKLFGKRKKILLMLG